MSAGIRDSRTFTDSIGVADLLVELLCFLNELKAQGRNQDGISP